MRQVREGRHEEVVLLGVDGGWDRTQLPDEGGNLTVVLRGGAVCRGEKVAGALEEVGVRVGDARELAPRHRVSADKAQALVLRGVDYGALGARDVGDQGVRRGEIADQGRHPGDGRGEHHEVGPAYFLERGGAVDGAALRGFFQNFRAVHADDVPPRVARGEADGTPDQADPHNTQSAAHASAAMTRSFSPESPTVTLLHPG